MRYIFIILTIIVVSVLISCGDRAATTTTTNAHVVAPLTLPTTPAATFSTVCATCHGAQGEGNVALKTPSIAGLPTWYVKHQLHKFRTDKRGTHIKDAAGQQMHAIARLLTDDMITAAVATIENMSPFPTRNTLGGNAKIGKDIYTNNCIDCHRYNASGELAFHSAPLTGLQDWYLLSQLIKFRDGIRGHQADDEEGAKMHEQTGGLSDEQFRDILAYIANLAERYPPGK